MIIKAPHIAVLLGACVTGAIFLIPERDELAVRVIEDGDYTRAIEMLGGESERPTVETIYNLVAEYEESPSDEKLEKLRFALSLVDDPEGALDVFSTSETKFADDLIQNFTEVIAKRSLADEKPQVALKAYIWLNETVGLNEKSLASAIQASRYCTSQALGIELVHDHLRANSKVYEDLPKNFRSQMISMYREINRGSDALPYLKRELNIARADGSEAEAMGYFLKVSLESDKLLESVPVMDKFIQSTEAGSIAFDQLVTRDKEHESDADFLKFGFTHAAHCEWINQLDKAFDYYAKLAYLGNDASLTRCYQIYAWLQKQSLMRELLASLDVDRLNAEQVMAYSDLEADFANYDLADEILDKALLAQGADLAKVYEQKGLVALQQDKFKQVIELYEESLKHDPENYRLYTEIASIYKSLGNLDEALEAYRKVPLKELNKDALENYEMLAASMGHENDLLAIAKHWITKKGKNAISKPYLELAERLVFNGRFEDGLEVYEAGRKQFPDSAKLELAQIELLVEVERIDEAFELLEETFRADDSRYTYRALAIGQRIRNSTPVFKLLKLEDPLAAEWEPTMRIELAYLYRKEREWQKAIDIWQSAFPGAYQVVGLKARQCYDRLEFEDAAVYQEAYIKNTEANNSEELTFMGDIYRKLKRTNDSKRAYALALDAIETNITTELESVSD